MQAQHLHRPESEDMIRAERAALIHINVYGFFERANEPHFKGVVARLMDSVIARVAESPAR